MSIAEELAKKFGARTGSNTVEFLDRNFRAAIDEALELAAQEAEKLYDKTYWDDPSAGIAATIRRLKSPAGPVQPTDASPARESDHVRL